MSVAFGLAAWSRWFAASRVQPKLAAPAGRGDVFVLVPVAVADDAAAGALPGQVQQVAVEPALARQRVAGFVAEHAVHAVEPAVAQHQALAQRGVGRETVEGLLVLAPADVADEAVVVQRDALPAQGGAAALAAPAQPGLVELERARIRHRRIRQLAVGAGVETVAQLGDTFELEAGGEALREGA
jgi:hypothetical protein